MRYGFPRGAPFSAAGPSAATPFGTFNHGVDMTGGNGAAGSKHGPLDFTVNGVTTADFITGSGGYASAQNGSIIRGAPVGEIRLLILLSSKNLPRFRDQPIDVGNLQNDLSNSKYSKQRKGERRCCY
jgi:hypothetical protein